jgi:hypothetical protein
MGGGGDDFCVAERLVNSRPTITPSGSSWTQTTRLGRSITSSVPMATSSSSAAARATAADGRRDATHAGVEDAHVHSVCPDRKRVKQHLLPLPQVDEHVQRRAGERLLAGDFALEPDELGPPLEPPLLQPVGVHEARQVGVRVGGDAGEHWADAEKAKLEKQ